MTSTAFRSRRPRRVLFAAAGVAALAVGLTACAPGSNSSGGAETEEITAEVTPEQVAELGDITLTGWADVAEQGLMEQFIPRFEDEYPNVTVDMQYKSFNDLIATVVNAANSEDAPDVFQGNIGYAVDGALVEAGLVRPLDDVAEVYGWDSDAAADTLAPARWNEDGTRFGSGTLYGMSVITEVQGIYYNKAKLEALGLEVPQSIDELEAALPVAAAAGEQPIMLGNADQYAAMHLYSDIAAAEQDPQDIRDWVFGEKDATFATEGNLAAAERIADWAQQGWLGEGYDGIGNEDAIARFADGEGVFFVGGSWNGAKLTDAPAPGFGMSALPDGGVGAIASPWHISSNSDASPAAIAFLDMLRTPETAQEIVDTGRLPVLLEGVSGKGELESETLAVADATIAAGGQVGYYDWTTTDMFSVMGGALQELMAGRITAEEFADTVQADWEGTYAG